MQNIPNQLKYWSIALLAIGSLLVGGLPITQAATTCNNPACSSATPQTEAVATLGLDEAIEIARRNNPRLLSARAEVQTAEGERINSGLWENPELILYSEEVPIDSGGISDGKNMIGLSQTFPFPGKKSLERQVGDLGIEQGLEGYRMTELNVVRDVKIAFYSVQAAQSRVAIFEELATLSESLANMAEKRVNAGETSAPELLRAEIEWDRAVTEAERSKRELTGTRQRLAVLLGQNELPLISSPENTSTMALAGLPDPLIQEALQHHPQIIQARLAVQKAEAAYKRSRREALPDFTLEAAFGSRDAELEESENLAEFSISLPLPLINRGQGAKRVSEGRLAAAEAYLSGTEQALFAQYHNARSQVDAATKRVDRYHEAILPKAETALALMQRGFQEGKFSFLDLLDTQRTIVETRLDYQEAWLELNVANATLTSLLTSDQKNPKEK